MAQPARYSLEESNSPYNIHGYTPPFHTQVEIRVVSLQAYYTSSASNDDVPRRVEQAAPPVKSNLFIWAGSASSDALSAGMAVCSHAPHALVHLSRSHPPHPRERHAGPPAAG